MPFFVWGAAAEGAPRRPGEGVWTASRGAPVFRGASPPWGTTPARDPRLNRLEAPDAHRAGRGLEGRAGGREGRAGSRALVALRHKTRREAANRGARGVHRSRKKDGGAGGRAARHQGRGRQRTTGAGVAAARGWAGRRVGPRTVVQTPQRCELPSGLRTLFNSDSLSGPTLTFPIRARPPAFLYIGSRTAGSLCTESLKLRILR